MSSALNAINMIATIVRCRAAGMTLTRLPFFVWSQLVTALLLLLAFPALQAAAIFQLMDRVAGTSFFLPSGLMVGGVPLQGIAGGGNPLLWQHLFWFLGHPEVYVLILPAMGIVAEVITTNARRPLWGYGLMVSAVLFMGGMSMIVWAHHMFLTGMGTTLTTFFQVTTIIISIPSVILISSLVLTLWGGSIRFTTPMLFALAFLPMFGIGGLTGLPLGLAASDVSLHDTYYVVAHFHYLVAPGTVFALFAGIYHWFRAITGRALDERLGKIHFWGSFVCMNLIFLPMFAIGLMGVNRRLWDAGASYALAQPTLKWQTHMTYAAFAPRGLPTALRLEYRYKLEPRAGSREPGTGNRKTGTDQALRSRLPAPGSRHPAPELGMWLFLASEAMLFGSLFSAYVMLRAGATSRGSDLRRIPVARDAVTGRRQRGVRREAHAQLIGQQRARPDVRRHQGVRRPRADRQGITPATSLMWACWLRSPASMPCTCSAARSSPAGWPGRRSAWPSSSDRDRWLARIEATRRYWLFVDLVWLLDRRSASTWS